MLSGGRAFFNSEVLPVSKKLTEWWKIPDVKAYKGVAFTPQGGWVALADQNTFHAEGIAPEVLKRLTELRKEGVEIHSVVFAPSDGCVLLEGNYGVWPSGVSE